MIYFNSKAGYSDSFSRGIILENHQFEKRTPSFLDVFLSHSSKDQEALPAVIGFLKQHGANVYIDKADKDLPAKTSPETGAKLKERIDECRKFIVLVSDNSKDSRWIPWELGIADEMKAMPNVALLPDTQNQSNDDWVDQEYLGLYSRIVFTKFADY